MKYIVQPVFAEHAHMPGVMPGKTYIIQAVHSDMLVSTRKGEITVEQRDWAEQTRQQWTIEPLSGADSGYFRIVSVQSGKVLDVAGESTEQGARVIEWDWHNGPNQQWAMEHLGDGLFRIRARHSGQVLDVEMASTQEGAPLIQFDWHEGDNQRWRLSTIAAPESLYGYDSRITVYSEPNYTGLSRETGLGSYASAAEPLGGHMFRSAKVPEGVHFTLFSEPNFQGKQIIYQSDVPDVSDWPAQSSLVVQSVVTAYEQADYQGRRQDLPVGRYTARDLIFGDNALSSLKVPSGLVVYLYENSDFTGQVRVFTESAPYVRDDFSHIVSGVIVKMAGIVIPKQALKYGDRIGLQAGDGCFLSADHDGMLRADRSTLTHRAEFALVRVGDSKLRSYVSYGDQVALQSVDGRYLELGPSGVVAATAKAVSDQSTFTLARSGSTIHDSFVSVNDTLSLSIGQAYLVEAADGTLRCEPVSLDGGGKWKVQARATGIRHCPEAPPSRVQVNDTARVTYAMGERLHLRDAPMGTIIGHMVGGTVFTIIGGPQCSGGYTWWQIRTEDGRTGWSAEGGGHYIHYFMEPFDPISNSAPPSDNRVPPAEGRPGGGGPCVAEACDTDVCGLEGCGVDVCGAAACWKDGLLLGVCGAAASGLALCAADFAAISACGAAAGVVNACGVDLCGGAACALEACGGAACGIAACGADLCGGAVFCPAEFCLAEACGADVCAVEVCPAEACAAEACGAETCGAEACAAEACAAEAGLVEACPADACALNVCALNFCPADACAADACGLDLIPIIPGI
jgi:hypothetical protein